MALCFAANEGMPYGVSHLILTLSLKRLSIFAFRANNPHNPFSPHCRGEKVRMRGSDF